MSREAAIRRAEAYFDSGGFEADLARRVAIPTESQNPDRAGELKRYLDAEIVPALEALGFRCRLLTHEKARGPFLAGERIEVVAVQEEAGADTRQRDQREQLETAPQQAGGEGEGHVVATYGGWVSGARCYFKRLCLRRSTESSSATRGSTT